MDLREAYGTSNKQTSNFTSDRDETYAWMHGGMLTSMANQMGDLSILLNLLEPRPFRPNLSSTRQFKSTISNDAANTMDVFKRFVDLPPQEVLPVFEQMPLELNGSRGLDLLGSVLDQIAGNSVIDCRPIGEKGNEDLSKVFDDQIEEVLEPAPIQADVSKSNPNPSLLDLFLSIEQANKDTPSFSMHERKRPLSQPSPSLSPKRTRTSSIDGEPTIHKYQEKHWMEQFNELIKFKEQHGHCRVPHKYPENQSLATWVKRQRYQYKLKMAGRVCTLTSIRLQKLEDISFVWDSHANTWGKRFQELEHYRKEHGNCNVPANFSGNQELGIWVKCQRRQYSLNCRGKSSSMTLDRMRALNELGFNWNVNDASSYYNRWSLLDH